MIVGSLKVCDLCGFSTENREKFAGHRSGHVRNGLLTKRVKIAYRCDLCDIDFADGRTLAGHRHLHDGRETHEVVSVISIKRRLIAKRNHECEICHTSTWMNQPVPITLDHIDGNSDNNIESNLRLLCPNCHAQTPTFGGKNKGKFPWRDRYRRMKDYAEKVRDE